MGTKDSNVRMSPQTFRVLEVFLEDLTRQPSEMEMKDWTIDVQKRIADVPWKIDADDDR
jgi:hypothetical protein